MHMSSIDGPGPAGRSLLPRWAALLVVLGLMACQTHPSEQHEPHGPSLYLELASLNGEPVTKALVRLSSGEEQKTTEQGTLLLDKLPVGPQALQVQAEGFSSTVLAFDMGQQVRAGARLNLLPLGEPRTFDANETAELDVGGVQLTVPAGALRDAQGNPIQGEVEVYLSALDLDNGELLAAPGLLEGVPVPGAEPVGLESLGMVSLVFRQDDRVIPFARGTHIGGNVPGRPGSAGTPDGRPGTRRSALSSTRPHPPVPIWRMDAENGRWVPTGDEAVVTGSRWEATLNNTPSLFNVALPFWWRTPEARPDNPLKPPTPSWVGTACLEVKVEDENGAPVAGRMVVAQGVDYTGLTRAMTDAGGRVRLEVMKGRLVDVDAGGEAMRVSTGGDAGTCSGQGAPPVPVPLTVAAPLCTPGSARDCASKGPTQGICRAAQQTCDARGSAWSACEGEVVPQKERCETPEDDDCDGTVNESCKRLCQEGETQPCYEGPEGTEDVGMCHGGTRRCVAEGTAWSTCAGQVLPAAEDYTQPEDEDCDGLAGLCSPGASRRCAYTGPAGTEDVGVCRAGTQTCNGTGTAWNACTGEVTPQTESCTRALDEDCDGLRNEAPCTWVPTTSMSTARNQLAAVVLKNGHVLVMGGANKSGEALDTAEVYDPVTTAWTPVGNMKSKRTHLGAVLLNDGRVLAVGGWDNTRRLKTAEVYDPVTREWTLVQDMNGGREFHTVTLLSNGKVLVTGGAGVTTHVLTAEVYDPVANTWTWTAGDNMSWARDEHGAVLLSNGQLFVTGGDTGSTGTNTAEVYDPVARNWTPVDPMSVARTTHAMVPLSTGEVLVVGGSTTEHDTDAHSTAAVYNPMPRARLATP